MKPDTAKAMKHLFDIENNFRTHLGGIKNFYNLKDDETINKIDKSFRQSMRLLLTRRMKKVPKKIGFFPVAGNPIHWGHLLTAFKALAKFKLDKIVFICGGYDPRKPKLLPPSIRYPMIEIALKIFNNLFELSDIPLNSEYATKQGEINIFNELNLQKYSKSVIPYYIVGSDHFNWIKNGKDDTLKILTENMNNKELNKKNFKVNAIFIARNINEISQAKQKELEKKVNFDISILVPDFSYSSTQIRNAYKIINERSFDISMLKPEKYNPFLYIPYGVFIHINTSKLY